MAMERQQFETRVESQCYLKAVYFAFLLFILSSVGIAQRQHPYLFYTTQRTERLKERINSDTLLAGRWDDVKQQCENWIDGGRGGNAERLAFAYAMTGDKRFADRAKELLMEIINRPAWDGMDDRTPRWNAGLGTSHTNWTVSVVYDAIYNTLSKEERKYIASKIVKLGIEPSLDDWLYGEKRIQSLNNMGHNWWAAIVFEAGTASLAVMNEIPEAKNWAAAVMESSKEWFSFAGTVLENKPPNFDTDGGFYESVSYANYAVSEYLLFRVAWTNAIGSTRMPYDDLLQKTVDWFISACYPRESKPMLSLNFGDSNDFANGEKPAKLLIALGLGKDDYYWYLQKTARMGFREDLGVSTPMGMLYHPESHFAPVLPSLKPSALYASMGWGMLRSSWEVDATLLGVKSGFTWNHAHADAGSFVLYHKGEYLLIDGGDVGYGNPEYSSYFVTSRAHNVVQFNGEAQHPQDQYHAVKNPGRLYYMIDGGFLKYILSDATGPTSRNFLRNYRNFLWVGDVILVIDDLKTYEAGQLDFLLHFDNKAEKRGPDLEVTKDSAAILFRPLFPETLPLGYPHDFPEKMKFQVEYGLKDRTTNVKIPYYVISPPQKLDRVKFINAIILLDEKNRTIRTSEGSSGASGMPGRSNLPIIEKLEGNNYIGVRILQNGIVTEVYVNLLADGRLMHRNANNNINGWETDAYILSVSYSGAKTAIGPSSLKTIFVANGSYLRKGGQVMLSSLSKVFMNAEVEKQVPEVILQGQPLIRANLLTQRNAERISLNGQLIKAKYSANQLLELKVGD